MKRRALRRRYGRSTESGQRIKFGDHDLTLHREPSVGPNGPYWRVVGPRILRGGRMDDTQLASYGTVHDNGKIHAWGGKGEAGRHYKYALEEVLQTLVAEGKARNVAKEKRDAKARKEEEKTGSFIVKVSNGMASRFHSFPDANRWAEKVVGDAPNGTRAEFFRDPGRPTYGDGSPFEGIPWTEPFHVVSKNEHGRINAGSR